MTNDDTSDSDPHAWPALVLEAAPRYVIGFPLVIAVTYENRTPDAYGLLPDIDLASVPWGLGFDLTATDGGPSTVRSPRRCHDEFPAGVELAGGASNRMLFDLTDLGIAPPPELVAKDPRYAALRAGKYRLTVSVGAGGPKKGATSNAVTVELVEPSPTDAAEATRLRKLAKSDYGDTGEWRWFLNRNWNTVVPSPALSFDAQRQLALHLFLHRAAYGPDVVAKLDEKLLDRITEPFLAADVAAFRYEIHAARHSPDAKALFETMVGRWPGVKWRFEQKDVLDKPVPFPLARQRAMWGAASYSSKPPDPPPYTK